MSRKRSKKTTTKQEPKVEEILDEIIEEPKEKRSLSGKLLRIPGDVLYFVFGLIAGSVLGIVSVFFFPVFVPFYMLKARFTE